MIILESPYKKESLNFYEKLNFTITEVDNQTFVSDKGIIIRLNKDNGKNPGIIVFKENIRDSIEELSSFVKILPVSDGFEFSDPSGTKITLIEAGKQIDSHINKGRSLAGNFAGVSIGLSDPAKSIKIWELLDFKIVAGSAEHGWAAMKDKDGSTISILKLEMCPHKFFNPSLTYFNGKNNLQIIEGIRNAGIRIEEEITAFNDIGIVDNIIIREPGGIGFFIFND